MDVLYCKGRMCLETIIMKTSVSINTTYSMCEASVSTPTHILTSLTCLLIKLFPLFNYALLLLSVANS